MISKETFFGDAERITTGSTVSIELNHKRMKSVTATASGVIVKLPPATHLPVGGPLCYIYNVGSNEFAVHDSENNFLTSLPIGKGSWFALAAKPTPQGIWCHIYWEPVVLVPEMVLQGIHVGGVDSFDSPNGPATYSDVTATYDPRLRTWTTRAADPYACLDVFSGYFGRHGHMAPRGYETDTAETDGFISEPYIVTSNTQGMSGDKMIFPFQNDKTWGTVSGTSSPVPGWSLFDSPSYDDRIYTNVVSGSLTYIRRMIKSTRVWSSVSSGYSEGYLDLFGPHSRENDQYCYSIKIATYIQGWNQTRWQKYTMEPTFAITNLWHNFGESWDAWLDVDSDFDMSPVDECFVFTWPVNWSTESNPPDSYGAPDNFTMQFDPDTNTWSQRATMTWPHTIDYNAPITQQNWPDGITSLGVMANDLHYYLFASARKSYLGETDAGVVARWCKETNSWTTESSRPAGTGFYDATGTSISERISL